MEAHHTEGLRKQKVINNKQRIKKSNSFTKAKTTSYFDEHPGAGLLIGLTTVYMDSHRRARSCYSAKLPRRYNSISYMQQY